MASEMATPNDGNLKKERKKWGERGKKELKKKIGPKAVMFTLIYHEPRAPIMTGKTPAPPPSPLPHPPPHLPLKQEHPKPVP